MSSKNIFFCDFLRSGSKGGPGWSSGPSLAPSRAKKDGLAWSQGGSQVPSSAKSDQQNITMEVRVQPKWVGFVNQAGVLFLFCCFAVLWCLLFCCPGCCVAVVLCWWVCCCFSVLLLVVLTFGCLIVLLSCFQTRGENLWWMPPRCLPDAFQMAPR